MGFGAAKTQCGHRSCPTASTTSLLGLQAAPNPLADLTPREREVIRLVADGRSDREIGDELFITTRTASTHVTNILGKLALPSRTAAAAWAIRHGVR